MKRKLITVMLATTLIADRQFHSSEDCCFDR